MGIRGLNTVIKKIAPNAIKIFDISKYRNCKVAIDCSILLYKFKYASRAENSHLIGLANRVKFYLMNGVLPIFVFDGVPPEAKKTTLVKRQANKEKMYVRLEKLRAKIPENEQENKYIEEEIEKLLSQLIVIKKIHIDSSKELLQKAGIPYCTAPEDAEKYCAFLQKNGLVDYTVTDDTDATTFGCPYILKTSINKNIIEIDTNAILEKFEMSHDSFVDFCILSGCDYTNPIPQIGPVTSFNLIKKHGCIEEILKTLPKEHPHFDYNICRKIFKEFDYEVPEKFSKINVDKQILLEFLNLHDFKENVISKFIKILF
jgi:flap endonuclease-1